MCDLSFAHGGFNRGATKAETRGIEQSLSCLESRGLIGAGEGAGGVGVGRVKIASSPPLLLFSLVHVSKRSRKVSWASRDNHQVDGVIPDYFLIICTRLILYHHRFLCSH